MLLVYILLHLLSMPTFSSYQLLLRNQKYGFSPKICISRPYDYVKCSSRTQKTSNHHIMFCQTIENSFNNMTSVVSNLSPFLTDSVDVPSIALEASDSGAKFSYKVQNVSSPILTTVNPKKTWKETLWSVLKGIASNWLILGEIFVIALAKHNPALGASGGPLRPEITISQMGVFFIFFINGIALQLVGGSAAEMRSVVKTNLLIQTYNFGFIPILVSLLAPFYPDAVFRDGLLVLSVLPCTINICVAQTLAAGGNMGTAIFNAIFANVCGVFLTPLLAIWTLGAGRGVSLLSTLKKLGNVVILPLVLGQLVRPTPVGEFFQRINKYARTLSSLLLLAIVYNVFSDTFLKGIGVGGDSLVRLMIAMPTAYMALSALFWIISKQLLPTMDPPTRAAALLCSSQKTLAFGIPFIKTALGTRPDLAYILAPLLMYAPAQLLLGSAILVPSLRNWIRNVQSFESGGGI